MIITCVFVIFNVCIDRSDTRDQNNKPLLKIKNVDNLNAFKTSDHSSITGAYQKVKETKYIK